MFKPSIDPRVAFLVLMAAALAGCSALFQRSKASTELKSRQTELSRISADDHTQ